MNSFKERLLEAQAEYHYRLKTVVDLNDERMEDVERLLHRYHLIRVGAPVVLDADLDTLEFADLDNEKISYLDFALGVPISAYILQQEMRALLNVPEKFVVVRADNEAVEVDSAKIHLLQTLDKQAAEKGLEKRASLLSTDPHYLDVEQPLAQDLFGDKYNRKFLNLLSKVASTRKSDTYVADSELYPTKDLVKLNAPQDTVDFNKDYHTPKPVYKNKYEDLPEPVNPELVNATGGMDDDRKRYFKVYQDKQGKKVVSHMLTQPVRGIKK